MPDVLTTLLISLSLALAFGGVVLFCMGLYRNYFEQLALEVRTDSTGGVVGSFTVGVRKLGALNRQLLWPAYEQRLRVQLIRGGEPHEFRPEDIIALQELGFVATLLLGFVACNGLSLNPVWALLFGLAGAVYPLIWVRDQVKRRHHLIQRALPYSLDLLTLAVEAGLDFTAALGKVVEKGKAGPLRDEFQVVLKQLKVGKTREEALKELIARVGLPALTLFVTALIQADRMGTSLGKILRIQSTQMRADRSQRAEKLANEAPVKMLFPLIACIFPTVFLVLFGPLLFAYKFGQ